MEEWTTRNDRSTLSLFLYHVSPPGRCGDSHHPPFSLSILVPLNLGVRYLKNVQMHHRPIGQNDKPAGPYWGLLGSTPEDDTLRWSIYSYTAFYRNGSSLLGLLLSEDSILFGQQDGHFL
nr:uncharacterized protein LOC106690428 isoform X2 [Halyomorpha halys]